MNEMEAREIREAIDAADILVQSKISDGKRQCEDAIRRVEGIRAELQDRLRSNN